MMVQSSAATVATPSGERAAMNLDLELIADIRAGAPAIRARAGRYLPQYEMESVKEYSRRVAMAPWRPEFVDSLRALASKPFTSDVKVADGTPELLAAMVDDIDGRGNNLTQFAREAFTEALANGVHAVLVDYPAIGFNVTVAEEKALGAKPYWVHVPVTSIVALRTSVVNGREVVTHLRLRETVIEPDGFGEKTVERIRVLEPGRWELWEKQSTGLWSVVSKGEVRWKGGPATEVPVALFFTGERLAQLQTRPPLRDLAEVQIDLFRALSRQDEILTYSGSPMLAASGLAKPQPDEGSISVGPKTILFAPTNEAGHPTRWEYVSPDPGAIAEIRHHIASIVDDMHRLGMQPTVARAGNQTATASSIDAAKAHCSLQAWAIALKDCLEHAFQFSARLMNNDHETVVQVFTDFTAGDQNTDESKLILLAEGAGVISKRTAREELRRRDILGPQFDPVQEERRLREEVRGTTEPEHETVADAAPPTEVLAPGPFTPPNSRARAKRRASADTKAKD